MSHLVLTPGTLTLSQIREISRGKVTLELAQSAIADINTSAGLVQQVLDEGRTVYGINTGFGLLANTKIAADDLQLLQRSIVLSHAAGTGKP
ncbi:aromatic amino acid lyase, partial [Shewanella sp. 0m-11]